MSIQEQGAQVRRGTAVENRRALVVNCYTKKKTYNLGAAKLADWLRATGWEVTEAVAPDLFLPDGRVSLFALGFELVCLSVIFSWDAVAARDLALAVKANSDVWCGGPGMFRIRDWWRAQTGLSCGHGLDKRFDKQRGNYKATFASRGCPGMGTVEAPKPCSFCIVPMMEGRKFSYDYFFTPAPWLLDSNLSALKVDFQEHIIRRYQETGTPLRDANSGFEPHTFDEDTYRRWKPVLRGPWRFAFDEMGEEEAVRRMMLGVLKGEPPRRKQVYVLVGNEPIEACYERVRKVIDWGGEPYCQFERPLDYVEGPLPVQFDWTEQRGQDFCRYYNRHLYRYAELWEYSNRKGERPPFEFLCKSWAFAGAASRPALVQAA